jgi:A/G-specific adenine glycosylase
VPCRRIAAAVVRRNDHLLITRRPHDGLLGGLWEFPGGKVRKNESAEEACVREVKEEVNLEVRIDGLLARVRHAYTHFKIVMDVFRCSVVSGEIELNGPQAYRWVTTAELDRYPFPKANLKFIPLLKEGLTASTGTGGPALPFNERGPR